MFEILFNFDLVANYKQSKFSKTMLEKSLKFILTKEDRIATFDMNYVLLLAKINLVSKKQSCKGDALILYGFDHI